MTAHSLAAVGRRVEAPRTRRLVWPILGAAAVVAFLLFRGQATLPHDDDAGTFRALNDVRDWIDANRSANAVAALVFDGTRQAVAALVDITIGVLDAMGWAGVMAALATIGFAAGGRRVALLVLAGLAVLGSLGLWESSMQTLGLTIAAVVLSLALGVPLGILTAKSERVRAVITPVLDVMQIMPTFAYLAPMALLFLIGSASAAIATLIYAMPAAIRITALGIRTVPTASLEAATSLGATRGQLLRKVELPLARRALGLAVNQTIMLAVSMVVVTVLVGAPGLGVDILRALQRVNVGASFDAGLAIVVLAILLDRVTEAASRRAEPRAPVAGSRLRRNVLAAGVALTAVLVVASLASPSLFSAFPRELTGLSFREPVNAVVDWLKGNIYVFTDAIKTGFTTYLLNPLQAVLTSSPWWLVVAVAGIVGTLVNGPRPGIVAALSLLAIVGLGLWQHSMETLASVAVATLITLAIGALLGILSARSDAFARGLRPLLDVAQTMPAFVYLVPALALFDVGRFAGIVAAVIFATPPVIRLVDAGIRSVPATIVEAAVAAGSTGRQRLWKVQLPLARPALLLAVNQGIIMVLGMVVISGLVGGGGLGYDVVAGFAQYEDFGKGLAAGISLVLLGILLDRLTQGAGARRRPAPAGT